MSSLRRFTRRRKRRIEHPKVYDELKYLGSGSYGSVYAIPDTNMVLKEHRIFTMDEDALCQNWKKEFETQKNIYNAVHSELSKMHVGIVEPYMFSYATRDKMNLLIPQINVKNAFSCFFTMERVNGYASSDMCYTKKLYSILKQDMKLRPATIPPYLYLGSLNPLEGHITLDMLQGTQLVEFPNEAYNYCIVKDIGLQLLKSTFLVFFIIANAGYIPRDIEFVFNGGCHNTYISILDFNEVKTIDERKHGRNDYDIDIDLAHVYIDLCGLRSSRDVNPQAMYDSPTPQWKFLCSPIISPYAFFECVESSMYNIDKIVYEILAYVEKRCFLPLFERIPTHIRSLWNPLHTEFSNIYKDFDSKLQLYYIYGLFETFIHRKLQIPTDISSMKYQELLHTLKSIVRSNRLIVDDMNDWNSLWSYPVTNPTAEKHTTDLCIRKRKHSICKYISKKN